MLPLRCKALHRVTYMQKNSETLPCEKQDTLGLHEQRGAKVRSEYDEIVVEPDTHRTNKTDSF